MDDHQRTRLPKGHIEARADHKIVAAAGRAHSSAHALGRRAPPAEIGLVPQASGSGPDAGRRQTVDGRLIVACDGDEAVFVPGRADGRSREETQRQRETTAGTGVGCASGGAERRGGPGARLARTGTEEAATGHDDHRRRR